MTTVLTNPSSGMCTDAELRQRLTSALLSDIVERLAANPEAWAHLVGDGHRHTWARVPVREDVQVWVATWPTFQGTLLHSHDYATSAFRTVRGVLTEIRPDERGRLLPRKFGPGLTSVIGPGEIHDLRNELADAAVTIHAYSERLTSITYYDWDAGVITESGRVDASNCAGAHNWPGA